MPQKPKDPTAGMTPRQLGRHLQQQIDTKRAEERTSERYRSLMRLQPQRSAVKVDHSQPSSTNQHRVPVSYGHHVSVGDPIQHGYVKAMVVALPGKGALTYKEGSRSPVTLRQDAARGVAKLAKRGGDPLPEKRGPIQTSANGARFYINTSGEKVYVK